MFEYLREFLKQQPIMLLFLTIGLGYLGSKLRFKGIGLGMASVLFVGIALGGWGKGAFHLPEIVPQLGLLLFVYTIGLQAGPAFFRIMKRRGLALFTLALVAVIGAATVTQLACKVFGVNPALAVGLFCGGLTNTPALAAATEMLNGKPESTLLTIGYSVAYPLAVILPITIAELTGLWKQVNLKTETARAEKETGAESDPPTSTNLKIVSRQLTGVTLKQSPLSKLGVKVSRVEHNNQVSVARPNTLLEMGDIIHIVGTKDKVAQATALGGVEVLQQPGPESRRDQVDYRRILLTNKKLVGRKLADTGIEQNWNAVVTRIRRGDVDFVPTDDTYLERGDRLRVVAPVEQIPGLTKYLGDSLRKLSETDYLSLSLGILIGVLLGTLTLHLPGDLTLRLGLAGGPMLAALIFGWQGRSGPIIWDLPAEINTTFRDLGLVLFFAGVGIKSGSNFIDAVAQNGVVLLSFGAIITLISTLVLLGGSMLILKLDWVTATGTLAGGQTQPAILSFIGNLAKSEAPNTAYVAIMPTAMIAKIIMAQVLLWWLRV
ncbi:MAG: aspartate:alanine exchanger family transporter [Nostocaceae cyanobacterium]|nr:aspartate:alanine exchanger family transporter [Nostocaceae cyanobacterium]